MEFAVCDDSAADRNTLIAMVQQYCGQRGIPAKILQFSRAGELLQEFTPGRYHVVFLDIYMPGITGVEAARRLRKRDANCMLVFTTTSEEHALDSYSVYAAGYLLKPYSREQLAETLDWCVQALSPRLQVYEFVSGRERCQVPLREILYIEIYGREAVLHTAKQSYTFHRSLSEIEQELPEEFLRCHRSYLVNMRHIARAEAGDFLLKDGRQVPIGTGMGPNVRQRFFDWAFQQAWEVK